MDDGRTDDDDVFGSGELINSQGHMTKMVAIAINSKKKNKNFLLQNQKFYDFETLHEASRGGVLQRLYKSWSWDDLDLSCGKVNIGRPCI